METISVNAQMHRAEGNERMPVTSPFSTDSDLEHLKTAQAQALLSALVGFIQPIFQAYSKTSNKTQVLQNNNPESQIINMIEGDKLLEALQEFVVVNIQPVFDSRVPDNTADDRFPQEHPETAAPHIPIPVLEEPSNVFPSRIMDKIRWHVFNHMPIRVLAFDPKGSQPELIERNEILRRILPQMCDEWNLPESPFRSWWEKTHLLADEGPMIEDFFKRHAGYAILSHTWIRDTPGDVIYKDWKERENNQRGFKKISNFCQVVANNHKVLLGWMDTICINKDSSSELDESIRSMYKWYRGAKVCVTYLSDTQELSDMPRDSWFTRGWTLQELLAPKTSHFYNRRWEAMGSNNDVTIQTYINVATDISKTELNLCMRGDTETIPLSRRIQLAAKRHVTREEDTSYSLMGLLGVDISIAYGEGSERAFYRLVRELLAAKNILHIFNRGYRSSNNKFIPSTVIEYLDRSYAFDPPASRNRVQLDRWKPLEPIVMTHLGIRTKLVLVPALKLQAHEMRYDPIGSLSSTIDLSISSGATGSFVEMYNMMDKRIYTPEGLVTRVSIDKTGPYVATFGILNFGEDNDDVLLPLDCLTVPLDFGTVRPGNVRASDSVQIIPTCRPPVFRLQPVSHTHRIRRDKLGEYSMQLLTLHL